MTNSTVASTMLANSNLLNSLKVKLVEEYTDFEQDVLAIIRDAENAGVTTIESFKQFVSEHSRWYNDDLVWYIESVL